MNSSKIWPPIGQRYDITTGLKSENIMKQLSKLFNYRIIKKPRLKTVALDIT
jgi:hypothetical protein